MQPNQATETLREPADSRLIPTPDGPGRALAQPIPRRRSLSELHEDREVLTALLAQEMVEGVDFGLIPGCGPKPALLKPGAEKALRLFMLSPETQIVEREVSRDEVRYVIRVRLTHPVLGFVGDGIGSCTSAEEKHAWRAALCEEEWNETPADRRRVKWHKQGLEVEKIKQIRRSPADLENTVLKMAKKRALVDAALTGTAASDRFTQDIEDMREEIKDAVVIAVKEGSPPPKQAKVPIGGTKASQAPLTKPTPTDGDARKRVTVLRVDVKEFAKPDGSKGSRYIIGVRAPNGISADASTFSESDADLARSALQEGLDIEAKFVTIEKGGKTYLNIEGIVPVQAGEEVQS